VRIERHESREAWLAARGKGIGGSDAAAILGLSPWAAPLSLWLRKVGAIPDDLEPSDVMVWGSKVERVLIEDIAEQAGVEVLGTSWTLIRDATEPDLFCSPDGMGWPSAPDDVTTAPDFLVEVKNVHGMKAEEWEAGAPPYVNAQVQHALHVSGLPRALVGASLGGRRPVWCWVDRDPNWWPTNGPTILEFLRRIREEDPPPPTGHPADREALFERYPAEDGSIVALPSEAVDWTRELEELAETRKAIETREDELKNMIRAAIGTAEEGIVPGGLGRWKWCVEPRAAHMVKASAPRILRKLKSKNGR